MTTLTARKLMHGKPTLLGAVFFSHKFGVTVLVFGKSDPVGSFFAAIWAINHFWSR